MEGIHLFGKFEECECDTKYLVEYKSIKKKLTDIVKKSGLKIVGSKFYSFNKEKDDQFGWTGVFLLSESHISLHLYPEMKSLYIDVFTCNYSENNDDKARFVLSEFKKLFKAKKITTYKEIRR